MSTAAFVTENDTPEGRGNLYCTPKKTYYDGTPSYTNPLSALFFVLFLTLLFPATFTKSVNAVMMSTMMAATVGTYL
jgi:hypothetical protein